MASQSYYLEIVTPDRSVYKGEVASVVAPGTQGYFGVLSGHQPMMASLRAGDFKLVTRGGKERHLALGAGFFQVARNRAVVLADSAEWETEIDVNRAQGALDRARDRLMSSDSHVNRHRAGMSMERAMARLKVARAELSTHA